MTCVKRIKHKGSGTKLESSFLLPMSEKNALIGNA